MMNIQDLNVIRALGEEESIYDNEILKNIFILTLGYNCRINKDYALKINHDILVKAAGIWKSQHPILQSKIYRPFDINNPSEHKIGPTKYFVYMNKTEFNNVELVEYDKDGEIDYKKSIEDELEIPLDNLNGPVWRIKVIRAKDNNQFLFLYTSHHGIGDGKNAFDLFTNFIDIVASLLDNSMVETKIYESNHSMEDLVREYKSKENYKSAKLLNDFDDKLNKVSSKIGNKMSENVTRMDFFKLEKEKVSKLVSKMKKNTNGAKLNAVLNATASICLRNMYVKYNVDDIDEMNLIQIKNVANLRDKLGLSNHQMGVFSVILDVREDISGVNKENFWAHVESCSKELHKRIDNNEDIEQVECEVNKEFIRLLNDGFKFSDSVSHDFILSNLVIMKENKKIDVIKCEEYYCVGQLKKPSFAGSFYYIIVTYGGELNWSFMYNERLYSKEFIKELKESIIKYIDDIVENF